VGLSIVQQPTAAPRHPDWDGQADARRPRPWLAPGMRHPRIPLPSRMSRAARGTDTLDAAGVSAGGSAVGTLTVADLAAIMKPAAGTVSGFTGGGNERDGKADNLNPKQVALSLGYDSTSKHSTVEVAEPLIALSSWSNGGYALGPSDHQLFCTISPNYAVDVVFHKMATFTVRQSAAPSLLRLLQLPVPFTCRSTASSFWSV
jgi:hypothetical protein